MMLLILRPLVFVSLLSSLTTLVMGREFNYEVEKRVLDRISDYMEKPAQTLTVISNMRFSGAFPHKMEAADRDRFLMLAHSLPQHSIWYAMDDGSFTGFCTLDGGNMGYYREPGYSGYSVDDPSMQKYLKACFNSTNGEPEDCILQPGAEYVRCVDTNCEPELCDDEDSQRDCQGLESKDEQTKCEQNKKYCVKHEIVVYNPESSGEVDSPTLGYIPTTDHCNGPDGLFTQDIGAVTKGNPQALEFKELAKIISPFDLTSDAYTLGSCYYSDGKTLVQRNLTGDYAYCSDKGGECNAYVGAFQSYFYEPNTRPWYTKPKELQRPIWLEPYVFVGLEIGLSYVHPIYNYVDGKQVFAGILGLDYLLSDVSEFLQQAYGNTDTLVAVFEDSEPNFVIGVSTSSVAAIKVLSEDNTIPCPTASSVGPPCEAIRTKMSNLSGDERDEILVKAFERHREAGYPNELLSFSASDETNADLYLAQSSLYEQSGTTLRWRILVVSPAEKNTSDSIEIGNPLFGAVLAIGALGVAACSALVVLFYRKRAERAVANSDWRFTCAFITGCALFNTSSLTLLGPNTDGTCMLRMWFFHVFFVVALSPLFVKVWRMKQLIGRSNFRKVVINNKQAVLYTMPMILFQGVILMFISIFDPPEQTEIVTESDQIITQHIVCEQDTNALFITQLIYEGGLVLVGCVLAYQTRHLDAKFGESKQLIFAMYNILLVGVTFLIVLNVAYMDPDGKSLLQAIGVFWGTVVSSAAFVIPRLIEARQANIARGRATNNSGSVFISGLLQVNEGQSTANGEGSSNGLSRPFRAISATGKEASKVSADSTGKDPEVCVHSVDPSGPVVESSPSGLECSSTGRSRADTNDTDDLL